MTVSVDIFSLSALLMSKSIDTTQIDLIDDNARLPSKELLVRMGMEHSISSITTVNEDESIYSKHHPFMEQGLPLNVPGGRGCSRGGETTK
jgi:hypothetical protein